jgi:hypothetical protein
MLCQEVSGTVYLTAIIIPYPYIFFAPYFNLLPESLHPVVQLGRCRSATASVEIFLHLPGLNHP